MSLANATYPPPADPFTQPVTLLLPDGTPFNVTMDDFAQMHFWGVNMGILYGIETGMTVITIVAYVLLVQTSKRKTMAYVLNMLALIFNLIKSLLLCVYVAGPWQNPYAYFADDWSLVPRSAYANSIAASVAKVVQLSCMEASLVLQVNAILCTSVRRRRWLLVALSMAIGLMAIAFSFALMVVNCKAIMDLESGYDFEWLTNAASITVTISICFFFVIFTSKLGYVLLQRRKVGIRKFGPIQILFVMSLQTMIIPAAFSIIEFWVTIDDLYTLTLCLTSIMLPLSTLWAQTPLDENRASGRSYTPARKPLINSYGSDLQPSPQKTGFNMSKSDDVLLSGTSSEAEKDVESQMNNINIIISKS